MEQIDTTPLYFNGAIVQDQTQRRLDAARAAYRRSYDRGYLLSEQGRHEVAQRILDAANADLCKAELAYAAARGR